MRTLKDKYEYNTKMKKTNTFSLGYCVGVDLYKDYPKADAKNKALTREVITSIKENARFGDTLSKGIMCGVRDAANERKNRNKR